MDISQADFRFVSDSDMRRIVNYSADKAKVRRGGKTAIIATADFTYGMARMYAIMADVYNHPVSIQAFRSREEALHWLLENQ